MVKGTVFSIENTSRFNYWYACGFLLLCSVTINENSWFYLKFSKIIPFLMLSCYPKPNLCHFYVSHARCQTHPDKFDSSHFSTLIKIFFKEEKKKPSFDISCLFVVNHAKKLIIYLQYIQVTKCTYVKTVTSATCNLYVYGAHSWTTNNKIVDEFG